MITLTNRAAMPCTAEEQVEHAMRFLSLVFDHQDWVEVRLLPAGHGRWFQLADPAASRDALRWAAELNSREHEPQNVYFGANPRCDTGRRKAADVPLARVLFVDFDGGTTPDQALARIREAGLPEPTCLVASGGGVHAYWLLAEPITDMAAWTATMKAIIKATGSDKSVHDAPRIMRLPGTANVKPERPGRPMCHIVSMNEVRHPASAFPVLPTSSKSTPLAKRAHVNDSGAPSRRSDRLGDEAQRFIDTGKVEGERRPALFRIACDMQARGWTLPEAEAAIMGKVHLITPPLDDEQINDLRRQIGNAFKQDREPGRESTPAQRASQPETADTTDANTVAPYDNGVITFDQCVEEYLAALDDAVLPTGFRPFDDATDGGLPVGELTCLCAPPGAGKSALALQLVIGAMIHDAGLRALWCLGEMTPRILVRRAACVGTAILGDGALTMKDAKRRTAEARAAAESMRELVGGGRLSVLKPVLTVSRIAEAITATQARLVVIDYLQLMTGAGHDRIGEMEDRVAQLTALANTTETAIVVVSSMSKAAIGNGAKIGTIGKGSGQIDYAMSFVFLGEPDEEAIKAKDTIYDVKWHCTKSRNEARHDFLSRFDGSRQFYTQAVEEYEEFATFGINGGRS